MKDVELDIQILDPLQCDIEPHLDAKNHIRNECSSFSNGPLKGRNKEQEQEILNWIEAVIGEKLPAGAYEDVLRDGVILCRLINKIAPGSVNKIQTSGGSFKLMENIQRYITNKIIIKKKKKKIKSNENTPEQKYSAGWQRSSLTSPSQILWIDLFLKPFKMEAINNDFSETKQSKAWWWFKEIFFFFLFFLEMLWSSCWRINGLGNVFLDRAHWS